MTSIGRESGLNTPSLIGAGGAGGPVVEWELVARTALLNTTGGPVATAPIDTTGADLLIICRFCIGIATVGPGPAQWNDSAGNTWQTAVSSTNFGELAINYIAGPVTSVAHTFNVAENNSALAVLAWKGAAASPFDTSTAFVVRNGSLQPGFSNVVPTANNMLFVNAIATQAAWTDLAFSSGFALQDLAVAAGAFGIGVGTLVQGAATPINPTMTSTPVDTATINALAGFFGG